MFFELLNKAQKIDYIKSVVLGKEMSDVDISCISLHKYEDEKSGEETIFISFTTTNREDDTEDFVEVDVCDFCNDQVHANFMAKNLGLPYISALNSYAKENKDHVMQEIAQKCTEHYVETLDASQTALSDFYDIDENESLNEKGNTVYNQKTLDNYTQDCHEEQAEKS